MIHFAVEISYFQNSKVCKRTRLDPTLCQHGCVRFVWWRLRENGFEICSIMQLPKHRVVRMQLPTYIVHEKQLDRQTFLKVFSFFRCVLEQETFRHSPEQSGNGLPCGILFSLEGHCAAPCLRPYFSDDPSSQNGPAPAFPSHTAVRRAVRPLFWQAQPVFPVYVVQVLLGREYI